MHTLTPEQLARTAHGLLPLAAIAKDYRYVTASSSRTNGSFLNKEPHELFTHFERAGPPTFINQQRGTLVSTPLLDMGRFSPEHGGNYPRKSGGLKFIAWEQFGAALVLSCDPGHIANLWLAFVDLEEVRNLSV